MNIQSAESPVSRGALWFGLLGGAGAWTIHLLAAYAAAEFGCVSGLSSREYMNVSFVAWLEIALTAMTTLFAGVATLVAWRTHRRLLARSAERDEALAAEQNTAWAGLLTSGLFMFIIVFESIPILYYLRSC